MVLCTLDQQGSCRDGAAQMEQASKSTAPTKRSQAIKAPLAKGQEPAAQATNERCSLDHDIDTTATPDTLE